MNRNECDHGQLRRSCQICDLVEERDEAARDLAMEQEHHQATRRSEQALAAHVERLKAAWSEADSNGEESVLDDVFGHWLNGDDYDALAEVFDEAPLTSLARLKAKWQAVALEGVLTCCEKCPPGKSHNDVLRVVDQMARAQRDLMRRQAGGDV